jgi:hypothetical protein
MGAWRNRESYVGNQSSIPGFQHNKKVGTAQVFSDGSAKLKFCTCNFRTLSQRHHQRCHAVSIFPSAGHDAVMDCDLVAREDSYRMTGLILYLNGNYSGVIPANAGIS